jgi:2-polyprenyl-3-methyl-5-hydroxy-6-metoxy-1,4-benzoquinol methylase
METGESAKAKLRLPTSGRLTARSASGEPAHVHEGESIKCNLCGGGDEITLYEARNYGVKFRVVRCRNCGLAYINPRMPAEVIEKMYSTKESMNLGFAVSACGPLAGNSMWHETRFRKMERHYRDVNPSFKSGQKLKYLDMGCGFGQTLEFAKRRGWEAHGIDISDWVVEEGRKLGRDILLTNLENAPFGDGFFDVILMSEVIEHVTDPLHELREARRKLKRGGIMVIDTINIDSFFMRFLGEKSSFIEAGHLTYFSYRTLRQILEKAGFKVLKGYRGLEIDLRDYVRIYNEVFASKKAYAMELALTIARKIGFGDFCFGGISYYAAKA